MTNRTKIRVRYAETDQMGIVYYANYLVWMEIGRTNLLRDAGLNYRDLEEQGLMLPVAKAFCKYISPSYYDDEIAIDSTITKLSGPRIRIDYQMYRSDDKIVAAGYTEHAFISSETKRLIKMPDDFSRRVVIPSDVDKYITKI